MTSVDPTPSPAPPAESSSTRLVMTLGVAGFLSGLILVSVHVLTLPTIERNKEEALQTAIYHVLPQCTTYDVLVLSDGRLSKPDAADAKSTQRIFLGYDAQGVVKGFAIPASGSGFQDVIRLIYGYDADQKMIIGFEVLESKETPGLGDKIMKDEKFIANFTALSVEPSIDEAKPGSKTHANQVETITGATISSKAVLRALRQSLEEWRPAIAQYVQEHPHAADQRP